MSLRVNQLGLFVPQEVSLRADALEVFPFPAGRDVSTGSALGDFRRRLAGPLRAQ
jgi:hypothetical protein